MRDDSLFIEVKGSSRPQVLPLFLIADLLNQGGLPRARLSMNYDGLPRVDRQRHDLFDPFQQIVSQKQLRISRIAVVRLRNVIHPFGVSVPKRFEPVAVKQVNQVARLASKLWLIGNRRD